MKEKFRELLSEDDLFSILSHRVRREMITKLYEHGSLSFTQISEEWKLATGTIYHHLKILDGLISQNRHNHYHLTESGKEVFHWMTGSEGNVEINKINAFTTLSYAIIYQYDNNKNYTTVFSILFIIIGLYLSNIVKVSLLGVFFLPLPKNLPEQYIVIYNLLLLILFNLMYLLSLKIFVKVNDTADQLLFLQISYFPIFIYLVAIFLLSLFITVKLSIGIWVLLNFISQIIFLFLNNAYLISNKGVKIDRSVLIVVLNLYFLLLIAMIII